MDFAQAAAMDAVSTRTENGAYALNTTGEAVLDFFGTVGALRYEEENRITRLFAESYRENPLLTVKTAFYARDVRGGLGERRIFRILLAYMAKYHPEALRPNLDLVGVYGRYDDLYSLIGTPMEEDMWAAMKKQFEEDRENLKEGHAVSLLAKWIKTADASSDATRKLGILTAKKLGYSVYEFKRIVRALRKRIGIVEALMSAGKWEEITYSAVPSRAMMIYRAAFTRHDEERFRAFIQKAQTGEETIHSGTLYPYDIIEKMLGMGMGRKLINEDAVLEAQWKALPNYVAPGTNALVIADTSGSMFGRPMATSVGLAVYFAERNTGAYHNMSMPFSGQSTIQILRGETLAQKLSSINMNDWANNTNLKAAFEHVLQIAISNHVPKEEMPKSLIVISDMEIDYCTDREWTFYRLMKEKFHDNGYEIPNVVFWNVNSRHDLFHADWERAGVQLVSGQSASTFLSVMRCIDMTPFEAMEYILNDERYSAITVG